MHKIDRPDVVWIFGPEADDRCIMMIEPFAFLMAPGKLQALFTPYPLNLFVVHLPAFCLQQFANLAISITAILFCQTDKSQAQLATPSPLVEFYKIDSLVLRGKDMEQLQLLTRPISWRITLSYGSFPHRRCNRR